MKAELITTSGVGDIIGAEIDVQVRTAKRYPRDMATFIKSATSMATSSVEVAEQCIYALTRGDKTIEGGSIRLAEILLVTYPNIQAGARIISEGARDITAQGVAIDFQMNIRVSYEVTLSIMTKSGHRYGDDMVTMTKRRGCAVAMREAIFKIVPRVIWKGIEDAARKHAGGKVSHRQADLARLLARLEKGLGIDEARALAAVGVTDKTKITTEQLVELKGRGTALADGETSAEHAFPTWNHPEATKPGNEHVSVPEQFPEGKELSDDPLEGIS